MRLLASLIGWTLALGAMAACGEPAPARQRAEASFGVSLFAATPSNQWRLPNRLREISGLAVTHDGRLFGHDDERATLSQIDPATGAIVKSFRAGAETERGDFEGLAITPAGDFYLVTSTGTLLKFREGADGAHVNFERFDTGLRDICEVEGLAYAPAEQSLILACKSNHARDMDHTVALYAWSARTHAPAALWLSMPEERLIARGGVHPSSVEIDPATGRIILLAAREHMLAEVSRRGDVLSVRRLDRSHRQAEGATILPDGSLVIADEGGDGEALLSRYARSP